MNNLANCMTFPSLKHRGKHYKYVSKKTKQLLTIGKINCCQHRIYTQVPACAERQLFRDSVHYYSGEMSKHTCHRAGRPEFKAPELTKAHTKENGQRLPQTR